MGRDADDLRFTVAEDGALTEVALQRWGNPHGNGFGNHCFGAILDGEVRFAGFTVPRRITAGWHHGTDRWADGQFIRYTVDDARYS